jgi:hypothetical protein
VIVLWFAVIGIVPLLFPGASTRDKAEFLVFIAIVLLGFIVSIRLKPPNQF